MFKPVNYPYSYSGYKLIKNFGQNVVSMDNKFATVANIKWEESEQGWKQWCQSNGKFIIINFKHYRDNAK